MSESTYMTIIVVLTVLSLALVFILISLLSQMKSIRSQVHFISRNDTNKRLTFYGKSRGFQRLASDINEILDSYDARHEKILREDKEIKDTLTNMSHDIRTPLTSLKGYFELLDQTDDPDERRGYEDSLMEVQEDLARLTRIAQAISGRLHEHMGEDRLLAVWGLRFMRIDHLLPQAAWYVPDDRDVPQTVEDFEMTRRHNLHEWPAEYSVSSVSQRPEREPEGDDLPDEGE